MMQIMPHKGIIVARNNFKTHVVHLMTICYNKCVTCVFLLNMKIQRKEAAMKKKCDSYAACWKEAADTL